MSGLLLWNSADHETSSELVVTRMGEALRHRPYHHTTACRVRPDLTVGTHTLAPPVPGRTFAVSWDGQVKVWLVGCILAADGSSPRVPDEKSSASFVLNRYLARDVAGLVSLEGEFILAVWDQRSCELVVVNDRFGLYPHYYSIGPGGVAIAPELKALCQVPAFDASLDHSAISEFIQYQQLLGRRTWFEQACLLPPASVSRIRPGGSFVTTSYWDWSRLDQVRSISFDEAVEECISVFQRAVDVRTAGSRSLGIMLSGGLDSRTILGFANGRVPITTLTYGAPDSRDVLFARRLAARAKSDHHWFPLADGRWVNDYVDFHIALTEGFHGWHHAHGISMLGQARDLVDRCLTGWDGGTIMGGSINFYKDAPYRQSPNEAQLHEAFDEGFRRHFTWPGLTEAESRALLDTPRGRALRPLAREALAAALADSRHYPARLRADAFYIDQVLRRALIMHVVMARSAIEMACPYFDAGFVDFMYSLPEPIRTNPRFRREVLTRRRPQLAAVPYDRDLSIPHTAPRYRVCEFTQRAKSWCHRHGLPFFPTPHSLYADYEEYLRTDLRSWGEDLLLSSRTLMADLVDPIEVERLWYRHLSGDELWTIGKVAPLMTLELLLREMASWGVTPRL